MQSAVRFVLVLLLAGSIPAGAAGRQASAGVHGAWGSDADFGLGGRAFVGLGAFALPLEAVASFDWFFPSPDLGVDVRWWEVNAGIAYRFRDRADVAPYVGTGLNVSRFRASTKVLDTDVSGAQTEVGASLLTGLLFRLAGVRPFFEGRLELGGGRQFVLAAGLRVR